MFVSGLNGVNNGITYFEAKNLNKKRKLRNFRNGNRYGNGTFWKRKFFFFQSLLGSLFGHLRYILYVSAYCLDCLPVQALEDFHVLN